MYETAGPDKITFKINKDPNSQILEFKAMTYDGSNSLATKTMLELMSDSLFMQNYHAKFTDSFNYSYIAMNNRPDGIKHPRLFDDRLVRKAMALLTPLETMNKIVKDRKSTRLNSSH